MSEKEIEATVGGIDRTIPAKQSFTITGNLNQRLGAGLQARGYVDYFSSLATQQKYQQNVYHATNRQRRYGGNISGSWAEYVLNATLEQRDIFDSTSRLTRDGTLPRLSLSRAERPIGRTSMYFGVAGEYVTFVRKTLVDDEPVSDVGLTRFDVNPVLRIPFTKWPFLTVNSTVSWRGTYWTESLDEEGVQVPEKLGRSLFDFTSRITGPVFHRIWDNGTRKIKHVIEPTLAIQRTTAVDDFDRIVKFEGTDYIVGSTTRYTYALNNRLYTKRETSREVLNIGVAQTYYTDANAARYDRNYQSFGTPPTHFQPVAITARVAPTLGTQASIRAEWDHTVNAIRTIAANGGIYEGNWLQADVGWSVRRHIKDLPGFDEDRATHFLRASTTMKTRTNRVGGTYSFDYDMRRDQFLQQRYMVYYNAQCCGVAAEFQTWNMQNSFAGVNVAQDRRFNISVTLAGIGAVPNFFGGLSGQQNRR